jgi:hypothetical protein
MYKRKIRFYQENRASVDGDRRICGNYGSDASYEQIK